MFNENERFVLPDTIAVPSAVSYTVISHGTKHLTLHYALQYDTQLSRTIPTIPHDTKRALRARKAILPDFPGQRQTYLCVTVSRAVNALSW